MLLSFLDPEFFDTTLPAKLPFGDVARLDAALMTFGKLFWWFVLLGKTSSSPMAREFKNKCQ